MDFFEILFVKKSHICGFSDIFQKYFDFLTSKIAFSSKVPILKVVQNVEIYKKDYGVKNI